ncbi:MAG: sensor histidine kinase [Sphingobacteriia bacterium]|nr:MAG: sensor histidine kinase [Sphingobacteriia bacterium]
MNLKQRFAFLFTGFVAIILFIACTTIYFLYAGYRQEDFYNRISLEGNEVYEVYQESKTADSLTGSNLLAEIRDRSIFNENILIEDSSGNRVLAIPNDKTIEITSILKEKAKKLKRFQYTDSTKTQHVLEFHIPTKTFIYVSGFDRVGLRKLNNFQIILAVVFLGGLILTGVLSFLFVKQAVKPIVQLSNQMQLIDVKNLSKRISLKDTKDEINQIAGSFNSMMDRLKAAFDAQKSFVQHASHELRTPLAVMLSQTEVALNKEHTNEEYKTVFASLKEDQQNMIDLANSLLLLSKYETANIDTDWPLVRIDELLFDAISLSQRSFRDITIDFSFIKIPDHDEDLLLKCNESLIKSVFTNLIKNGYQYSINQKIIISILADNHAIEITFQNTGLQLSKEESSNMTLPFFRGQNADGKKGFGLGLSIIDRILTLHNGSLEYYTSTNDLNVFKVMLPKLNR